MKRKARLLRPDELARLLSGRTTKRDELAIRRQLAKRPGRLNDSEVAEWIYEREFAIPDRLALVEHVIALVRPREGQKILERCDRARQYLQAGHFELANHQLNEIKQCLDRNTVRRITAQEAKDDAKRATMADNRRQREIRAKARHNKWKAAADTIQKNRPETLSALSRLALATAVKKDLKLKEHPRTIERALKKLDALT